MDTKFIAGAATAAVLAFVIGFLIYGMLLAGYFEANTNQCAALGMEDMVWWAMIAFNVVWGVFIAFLVKRTNSMSFMEGLMVGAIAGFLISLTYDLQFYAMTTMITSKMVVIVDVIAGTAMTALTAAVTGLVMSKVS